MRGSQVQQSAEHARVDGRATTRARRRTYWTTKGVGQRGHAPEGVGREAPIPPVACFGKGRRGLIVGGRVHTTRARGQVLRTTPTRKLARRMRVFLVLAACAHAVSAQCDAATEDAESRCKRDNSCTACSDFNYGDDGEADCAFNRQEHCDEIDCCGACAAEIRAMFACEHGASCGSQLTCAASSYSSACPVRAPEQKSYGRTALRCLPVHRSANAPIRAQDSWQSVCLLASSLSLSRARARMN